MDENLKESPEYQTMQVNCGHNHYSKKREEKHFKIKEKKEDGNDVVADDGA